MAAVQLRDATSDIARRDRVLAKAIARLGPLRYSARDPDGPFGALVRAIVYQQLAGPAAQAIYTRVRATVGPALTPESLAAAPDAQLRKAGLSTNKLASLRDLAAKVSDGTVALTRSSVRSDEELIERLTAVRGIGPWTAQMYLLFQLRRLDVWPVGDLGVRQGYALIWGLPTVPEPKQLEELGERFRPYRTVVARYCWAALAEQRTQRLPTLSERKENEMSSPTPDAIDRYFKTDSRQDTDALVELFADDAIVVDERQAIEGHDAIRAWRVEGSASKYTYTTEITGTEQLDPNHWIVSARLIGNFPGGTADLRFDFTLDRGRIERLVIAP